MQQTKIKLQTSLLEFDKMHSLVDKTVARTIEIKVSRASIQTLIEDHDEMLNLLRKEQHTSSKCRQRLNHPEKSSEALHRALNGSSRKNSKLVVVDKKDLLLMLIDHSVLVYKIECNDYDVDG